MSALGSIEVSIGLDSSALQEGLRSAEGAVQKVGTSFKDVGAKMSMGITAPLLAIGAGALASAGQVESSQGLIQAQLGITAERAGELQGVVNSLFTEGFGGDMSEVQNAVSTVVRNMKTLEGASDETIREVTKNSLNLSTAFGADTNDVSKSINSMQQSFDGLDTKQAFDLIAGGFQNGMDYSGEFLDSVNEYSTYFQEMGFSAEEMFNVFGSGAESGAFQLDKVGDLVKEMNIRLSDGSASEYMASFSKETQDLYTNFQKTGEGGAEIFKAVTKEISEMDNETEAYTLGVGLMGTQFEDLDKTAVVAIGNASNSMEDFGGSMDSVNEAMNQDLGTVLTASLRSIQVALAPLGQELGKLVKEYLPPVIEKITAVGEWFTGLSDKTKMLILTIAGIALVVPPLLMVFGTIISAVGSIVGAFSAIVSAGGFIVGLFAKLRTVMSFASIIPMITPPIAIIVAAIAGLIAIGVLVYKNWDEIKEFAIKIWGHIATFFSGFFSALGSAFTSAWDYISSSTMAVFNSIKDFLVMVWEGIKTAVILVVTTYVNLMLFQFEILSKSVMVIYNALKTALVVVWEAIKTAVLFVVTAFIKMVQSHFEIMSKATMLIYNTLKDALIAVWEFIKTAVLSVINTYVEGVKVSWNLLKSFTMTIFNAVKDFLVNTWNAVVSTVTGIVSTLLTSITEKFNLIKSKVTTIITEATGKVTSLWTDMKTKLSSVGGEILTAVTGVFGDIADAMWKPIEKAVGWITSAFDKVKSTVSGILSSIASIGSSDATVTVNSSSSKPNQNATGNIFKKSTLLGGNQEVGEAGTEIVMPIERKRYMKPYASMVAGLMNEESGGTGGKAIVQNITINSPEALSPSEIAKKQLQASRRLAMEWG